VTRLGHGRVVVLFLGFEWAISGVGFSSYNGCRWRSSRKARHIGFHDVNGSIYDGFW
jgi:hypothetical protein